MLSDRKVTASVAALMLLASTSTVFAATEQEITDALEALFAASNDTGTIELGSPTAEGDTLVYRNVTFSMDSPQGAGTGRIETLTLTAPDLNDAGGLVADSVVAGGVSVETEDGESVRIASMSTTGLDVTPGAAGADPVSRFETVTAEDLVVEAPDQPPFSIDLIEIEASDYVDGIARSGSFEISGIRLDVDEVASEEPAAQQLKDLGYEEVVLGISGAGTWDDQAGTASLDDLTIAGENMGSVSLSAILGGFTPEVVESLQATEPSPEVMGQITLQEAAISFEDASITGKLLDMQAGQMGADRATFVEQISAALPLMLSAVGNPGFQEKLATAASAFLKDPQNITISIAPSQPIDLMTLMMTGQTAPQTLPDVLNAEVTANEPE